LGRAFGLKNTSSIYHKQNRNKYTAIAPEIFSFIENPEDTMSFFEDILIDILKHTFGKTYFFDLSDVKVLTIDAVMYIIVVLKNLKSNNIFRYKFEGNAPEEREARTLLKESGFYAYVNSGVKNINPTTDKIQITTCKTLQLVVAANTCDFVNTICNTDLQFTKHLYPTLVELMENTTHHAYKDSNTLTAAQWYLFFQP